MNRKRLILTSVTALALLTSGAVVASALNDVPQDAQPAPNPTADLNRQPVPPPVTVPQEQRVDRAEADGMGAHLAHVQMVAVPVVPVMC